MDLAISNGTAGDVSLRTRLRLGFAAALSLGLLAAPADAQRPTGTFFPGQTIDGPSADIKSVGDVDVASDGAGIITYVRSDGGEDHVFASLIEGGTTQGVFRVDAGQPAVIGKPVAATANGGRMAIAFANGAGVWVTVRPAAGQAFGPLMQLGLPGTAAPSLDLAINGAGYLSWSAGGDVRSAYLARGATNWIAHPAALDLDPAWDAGSGAAMAPRVTASADGVGLVAWGERDGAGATRVGVRRLVRDRIAAFGAAANAGSIDGVTAGSADMPDVAFEDDSSYAWVVFRQQAIDAAGTSTTRAIARRLRGSGFDDAATIDGGAALAPSAVPRVGLNGRGQGILTVEAPGAVLASIVKDDAVTPARVLGSAASAGALPVAGFAENFDGVAAWLQTSTLGMPEVRGRLLEDDIALAQPPPFGPDVVLVGPGARARRSGRRHRRRRDARRRRSRRLRPGGSRRPAPGARRLRPRARRPGRDDLDRLAAHDTAAAGVGRGVRRLGRHHVLGAARRSAGRHHRRHALHAGDADRRRHPPLAGDRDRSPRPGRAGCDAQPAHRRHGAQAADQDRRQAPDRQAPDVHRSARSTCAARRARASARCGSTTATARCR